MSTGELLVFIAAFFTCATLAGVETGLYCLNRIRLRARAARGQHSAIRIQHLLKDTSKTIIAILVGTNVATFIATATATSWFDRAGIREPEILATLILAPVFFVFAETLPKSIFQQKADVLTYRVDSLLVLTRIVFYPVILLLAGVTRAVSFLGRKAGAPAEPLSTRQGLRYFFLESRGSLSPYQSQIAENIMSLHHHTLADAMIPLGHIKSVDVAIGTDALVQTIRQVRFSRLPVYQGSPDRIVGILNTFEFMYETEHKDTISHLVRPATFLQFDTPIHAALHRMQSSRQLMVIVTNARGKPVGIATLKDLVEEIVGELQEA